LANYPHKFLYPASDFINKRAIFFCTAMYWYLFVIIPVNHHNQVINAVINFICKEWVLSIRKETAQLLTGETGGPGGGMGLFATKTTRV